MCCPRAYITLMYVPGEAWSQLLRPLLSSYNNLAGLWCLSMFILKFQYGLLMRYSDFIRQRGMCLHSAIIPVGQWYLCARSNTTYGYVLPLESLDCI